MLEKLWDSSVNPLRIAPVRYISVRKYFQTSHQFSHSFAAFFHFNMKSQISSSASSSGEEWCGSAHDDFYLPARYRKKKNSFSSSSSFAFFAAAAATHRCRSRRCLIWAFWLSFYYTLSRASGLWGKREGGSYTRQMKPFLYFCSLLRVSSVGNVHENNKVFFFGE